MTLRLNPDHLPNYRRQIRIKLIQFLYQLTFPHKDFPLEELMAFAWEVGNDPEEAYSQSVDPAYTQTAQDILDHLSVIDQQIESYLTDWKLDRLQKIDLSILRLAFYEILYAEDASIPAVTAVNEAIELAKGFSDDKSRKFISGVLGRLLQDEKLSVDEKKE